MRTFLLVLSAVIFFTGCSGVDFPDVRRNMNQPAGFGFSRGYPPSGPPRANCAPPSYYGGGGYYPQPSFNGGGYRGSPPSRPYYNTSPPYEPLHTPGFGHPDANGYYPRQ